MREAQMSLYFTSPRKKGNLVHKHVLSGEGQFKVVFYSVSLLIKKRTGSIPKSESVIKSVSMNLFVIRQAQD